MNPLHQFMIKPIIPFRIMDIDLSLTNSSVFMILTTILVLLFLYLGSRKELLIPDRLQASVELIYDFIKTLVKENIGPQGDPFIPLILTLFLFILFGNLLGMIPYGFTITSHIIVTFGLAGFLFLLSTSIGLYKHGLKFFRIFFPHGTPLYIAPILIPIEIISYFSRPISLSVRLFANMMAGHAILKVFAGFVVSMGIVSGGFLPLILTSIMTGFELLVSCLQAYVFTILTCLYLKDAIDLH